MFLPQGRLLNVLLNYIALGLEGAIRRCIVILGLPCVLRRFGIVTRSASTVPLCCVIVLLSFDVLLKGCLLFFEVLLNSSLELLNVPCDKDASALATGFWLYDEHDRGVRIALLLGHESLRDFFVPFFVLPLVVFNYFM